MTDPLLERLQRAVGPDYRVDRELRGGGMGRVFVAFEVLLKREVAIKVLRPELATTDAIEAFLREVQILASVRHPNVVVIHRTSEGEGLQFYIMEFVSGPTLEDRLAAGPLPAADVVQIGSDLLHGLETVHRLGLVHRDVKPGNVFLLPERALLGDFGIARSPNDTGSEGTRGYKAPEQAEGKPVTQCADIYSTGVVLYEAVSGRRFPEGGGRIDWNGVPHDLAPVLRRAVAVRPEKRWPDAATFRKALERTRAPNIPIRIAALLFGGLLIGALGVTLWPAPDPVSNPGALEVGFDKIDYLGPAEQRHVASSLLGRVRSDLEGHPDFVLAPTPGFFRRRRPPGLEIQGRIEVAGGEAHLQLTGGIATYELRMPVELWPALRDSITYRILLGVWDARSPLAPSLPVRALPRTPQGLLRFFEAELLIADAQWENAHRAYLLAETDSSCLLCSWRITEIERWLSREPDPRRVARARAHIDAFPSWYASLIRAAQLPLRARLDTLRAVTETQRQFFLGWFQLGDELFHRGPLAGHRRSEAITALETAARLRPDFGPAWEHLAWVATAEGDSSEAERALDSLQTRAGGVAPDRYSTVLRALLRLGFAWRFLPEDVALQHTQAAVNDPAAQSSPDLAAGPRLLPTFDAPHGAIAFGRILEAKPSRDLRRSGLVAQTLGSVALGRLADARALAQRLMSVAPEQELDLFAAELQAALALLDEGADATQAIAVVRAWIAKRDAPPRLRDRAAKLALLVTADSLAEAGQPRAALALTDTVDVDAVARRIDPFFRAVAHLQRAAWRAQIGDLAGARSELLWHEHTDVVGVPTGLPQAAEIDWAFGTLARWRLARLLDGTGGGADGGEACEAYAAVARLWLQAPAPYGARADSARTRATQLGCADRKRAP